MGSVVALLAAWVLWAQVHPDDPVRVVSKHASLEECREHADRMNQIIADALGTCQQERDTGVLRLV